MPIVVANRLVLTVGASTETIDNLAISSDTLNKAHPDWLGNRKKTVTQPKKTPKTAQQKCNLMR
jgi:hypothetical protein